MDHIKKTTETYDIIAPEYCRKTMIQEIREFEFKLLDRFLSLNSRKKPDILDIGCGDGLDTAYLIVKGAKAIGIDLSSGMLKEARRLHPECDFRKMDMRKLKFPDEQFDGVWASGCIYHARKSEVSQVFKEIQRVLKPDGIFSFNYKVGKGEGMESNPKSYGGYPRYFAYYELNEIRDLLKDYDIIAYLDYPGRIFGDRITHVWARKK